ncbi:MAG: YgaP family membrane protein [Pseudochelatococcus sp.]|uniref:YgaP family membrane protein n=1 Tax=Pseudochelatococcus sp. TaxID=2020869 RepID=UPI003D8E161C
MTGNVGGIDRILRIVAGLVVLSLVFVLEGDMRWWGLVGLVPLATGLFSFCPLYSLFGFSSCPLKGRRN